MSSAWICSLIFTNSWKKSFSVGRRFPRELSLTERWIAMRESECAWGKMGGWSLCWSGLHLNISLLSPILPFSHLFITLSPHIDLLPDLSISIPKPLVEGLQEGDEATIHLLAQWWHGSDCTESVWQQSLNSCVLILWETRENAFSLIIKLDYLKYGQPLKTQFLLTLCFSEY